MLTISALQQFWHFGISGSSSLAFQLFGLKILIFSSTTSVLWHSVPHFSSKLHQRQLTVEMVSRSCGL
ncbi:unnamed protein product [Rhizophagus irregularis]|nr:unnamed protein product [Rhizophagus irregularis]